MIREWEAAALATGLWDLEMNCQPSDGGWGIAQCLNHLAQINTIYGAEMRNAIRSSRSRTPTRRGPIHPGWLAHYFIRMIDAPPQRKLKAPAKAVAVSGKSGEQALGAFVACHRSVRELIRESEAIDLNRIRFKNPFIPLLRWTVGTGLLIVPAHDRRHLWQAKEVRRKIQREASPTGSHVPGDVDS